MATKRRNRLVPKGGIECFEVRHVTSIGPDGGVVTETEVTCPDGSSEPSLPEVLGAIEVAKLGIVRLYEGEDE